jgi:hypothetical protein
MQGRLTAHGLDEDASAASAITAIRWTITNVFLA